MVKRPKNLVSQASCMNSPSQCQVAVANETITSLNTRSTILHPGPMTPTSVKQKADRGRAVNFFFLNRGLNLADLTGTIFISVFFVSFGLVCFVIEATSTHKPCPHHPQAPPSPHSWNNPFLRALTPLPCLPPPSPSPPIPPPPLPLPPPPKKKTTLKVMRRDGRRGIELVRRSTQSLIGHEPEAVETWSDAGFSTTGPRVGTLAVRWCGGMK